MVLLSFLTMITRRKAMSQVVGFLSMENGLFFGAMSATYGMPMIVELGVALDVLVAMLVLGVFFFQIREQFDSLDLHHLESLKEEQVSVESCLFLLAIPSLGALFSALFGARRWAPELNVAVSLATFLAACALTARVIGEGNLSRGRRAVLHRSVQRLPGDADRVRGPHDLAVLAPLHARRDASTAA